MSSNFDFLLSEWKSFYKSAVEAEQSVNSAPRLCVFSCRYNLEQATPWLYNNDSDLKRSYRDNLVSLIHEQTFKDILHAAKEAFSVFLDNRPLSADKLTFINQLIDFLTADGTLDPVKLMEVPFTDVHYDGLMGVFPTWEAQELKDIIDGVNDRVDVG